MHQRLQPKGRKPRGLENAAHKLYSTRILGWKSKLKLTPVFRSVTYLRVLTECYLKRRVCLYLLSIDVTYLCIPFEFANVLQSAF